MPLSQRKGEAAQGSPRATHRVPLGQDIKFLKWPCAREQAHVHANVYFVCVQAGRVFSSCFQAIRSARHVRARVCVRVRACARTCVRAYAVVHVRACACVCVCMRTCAWSLTPV